MLLSRAAGDWLYLETISGMFRQYTGFQIGLDIIERVVRGCYDTVRCISKY